MTPDEAEQLKSFGKRIAFLRKQQGFSQEEFAEATGKMINTISNIERGLADPKFTTLNAIANALHVNISDLFCDMPPVVRNNLSDTTKNIIALIDKMPPVVQQVALKQLKSLSEITD